MRTEHILDRSVVLEPYGKTSKSKHYVPLSDRIRGRLRLRDSGDSLGVFPSKRARCGHRTTLAQTMDRATVEAVSLAAAEQPNRSCLRSPRTSNSIAPATPFPLTCSLRA
jgi:hypothetical protein